MACWLIWASFPRRRRTTGPSNSPPPLCASMSNWRKHHIALAGVKKLYEWDWMGAEAAYRQALSVKSERRTWPPDVCVAAFRNGAAPGGHPGDSKSATTWIRFPWPSTRKQPGTFIWRGTSKAPRIKPGGRWRWSRDLRPRSTRWGWPISKWECWKKRSLNFKMRWFVPANHPAAAAALGYAYAIAGQRNESEELLRELEHPKARLSILGGAAARGFGRA